MEENNVQDNNSDIDFSALLGELKTLNEGVVSENKKLDELVNYLIVKDKQEKEAKEAAEKLAAEEKAAQIEADQAAAEEEKKEEEESKEAAEEEAKIQEEKEQNQLDQQQTYEEILLDIKDEIELSNHLQIVNGLYIGIVIGLLWIKIIIDKVFK